MNAICGVLSLLEDSELTTDQAESIRVMGESAKTLLSLINSLLDFSKIESDQFELEVTNRGFIKINKV